MKFISNTVLVNFNSKCIEIKLILNPHPVRFLDLKVSSRIFLQTFPLNFPWRSLGVSKLPKILNKTNCDSLQNHFPVFGPYWPNMRFFSRILSTTENIENFPMQFYSCGFVNFEIFEEMNSLKVNAK